MSKLTIIMYHYVRNIIDSKYPKIKGLELDLFVEQINYLKKKFNIITMEELLESNTKKKQLPINSALLTFDDGYIDHYTNVYPILKENNLQGSFYIPAKPILEHKLLDVNKIHFILSSVKNINDLLSDIFIDINEFKSKFQLDSYNDYFSTFAKENRFDDKEAVFVKRLLQHGLPEELRNSLSSKYFEKYVGFKESAFAKELYMNKYQIRQMIRDGMHVGCHGYDHYWWDKLNKNELKEEIEKSKEFLKSLGCNMSTLTACYPYGSTNELVVSELTRQGCNLAFTTEVRIADTSTDSRFLYPRLDTNDFPPESINYQMHLA